LSIYQLVVAPEAYLSEVCSLIGYHPEFHPLIGIYARHPQLNAVDGDFPVCVRRSLFFDTEDIFCRFEWGRHFKGTEEMLPFFDGPFKPEYRDLSCGAVDLMLVLAVDFVVQHVPRRVNGSDVFPGTGPYDSVLKPPVRPFDLPFRLWRQCIGHLHSAFIHDPLPLRICLVGFQALSLPDRISSLDKPEDRVAIHIIRKRYAVSQPHRLQRFNMTPSVFPCYEVRIEKVTAVIVDARDKTPSLINIRRPTVMGRVVLNQLAGIVGDYLTIMMFPSRLLKVESVFFALSIMVGTDTSWRYFFMI